QPVLTSQHSAPEAAMRACSSAPYSSGRRGMNGAPKQVENVGCGSVTPRSVPATFEVKPERKWYIACAGVSLAIGGSTPKASQVSITTLRGQPPRAVGLALAIASSG